MQKRTLLEEVAATGPGPAVEINAPAHVSFHAVATAEGALDVEVVVEGSNDGGSTWVKIAAVALQGEDTVAEGFVEDPITWHQVRGRVTKLEGTGAEVDLVAALGRA